MLQQVVRISVTSYGTIVEEVELFCLMTGFRRRVLLEYAPRGSCDARRWRPETCKNELLPAVHENEDRKK